MSRILPTLVVLLALAACGNRAFEAPRNLDDACSIVSQRPAYHKAMKRTEKRWGVPVPVQMAFIYQESKFIGNNRTPVRYALGVLPMGRQSSAYGYAQALDATWDEYRREMRKPRARRDDIGDATDFIGWYMTKTREQVGVPLSDARGQYLAYHEGRGGYSRGSHRKKRWLLKIADEVEGRAIAYDTQLRVCRKR